MLDSLPIDPFIPDIVEAVRRARAVVIAAEPGAGKTTRVPPALAADGPLVLLQPRRVAARTIARRIADEQGWTLGREVGWQIRSDKRFGPDTRVLVATEGILTARFQQDPLVEHVRTIVLDEFHERSIHADLAIAMAKQAWLAREDLRLVVMSATMDTGAVSAFLNACPIVTVPGRLYPLDVSYAAQQSVAQAAADLVVSGLSRGVLCFLPGAAEIRRTVDELTATMRDTAEIVPLHGSLDPDAQDRALWPGTEGRPRVIVATNIAETSLTVPGVSAVVDSGWHKVARYDADRAIDSLETERITADAADQRAGRAGRLGPGVVRRLWDARDRLRPHREADIHRLDLSAPLLDVLAWGGRPETFEWFERPADYAIEAALRLLERLGAIVGSRLTDIGKQMHRLPLHPRLARMLVAAEGARDMARACALLAERHYVPARTRATRSDLLSALDTWGGVSAHVHQLAHDIEERTSALRRTRTSGPFTEDQFLEAVYAGYPDRVAQRRESRSLRVRLASGAGAVLSKQSGVTGGEFIVALDVRTSSRPGDADAIIHLASEVAREWLHATDTEVVHRLDAERGVVKAARVERYEALLLSEHPTAPDPEVSAQLMLEAWKARGPSAADEQVLRRLRFAGRDENVDALMRSAVVAAASLHDASIEAALGPDLMRDLDRWAPLVLKVPSGRAVRLEYGEDGSVSAAVKLQELFGLAETPRIGRRKEPLVLSLLAPNGRPVQRTRDLRSFWDRTYPEVRKELRGRYPKHPWPDDPWTATPSARAKRRPGS